MEENKDKSELYSKRVKASKRTYFFDIKPTRGNDYYLTITESKKRYQDEGFVYEKHKIFLYKEDFETFIESLKEAVEFAQREIEPEPEKQNGYDYSTTPENEDDGEELKWD
ncbi:MAG: DUF3276 family protein [Cytophagales bacterium]|nr:MAG: DUF3276 family protein [Cytophagales bacterium]